MLHRKPWWSRCQRHPSPRACARRVCHRGGSVASPVGLGEHHTVRRETARSGGGDARRVLLRERKAIHRHRLGGDVGGGYRAVSGAFRNIVIHRPIHRSHATFVHRNNFFLQGVV